MLPVSTFEIGNPIAVFVPVKTDNALFHAVFPPSLDGRGLISSPLSLDGRGLG